MRLIAMIILTVMVGAAKPAYVLAQAFASGSDGSFGPLEVVGGTPPLDLPPDGVIHATRINVQAGATLRFNRNPLNTPVYLLATEAIIIDGTIDVSGFSGTAIQGGIGGPGGFDGGSPGLNGSPGDGFGPGAGLGQTSGFAGSAAYGASLGEPGGTAYGSPLLIPLIGGSGGGATNGGGGGGGGGAVLLASDISIHMTASGIIRAGGGSEGPLGGRGSGGAIRLVAPTVSGDGTLDVQAGTDTDGHGRIRIDSSVTSRPSQMFTVLPEAALSVGSLLVVFPAVIPRLDILAIGEQSIPEGVQEPVQVLPFPAETRQAVTVQARNFTGMVPIDIVLTPENGSRTVIPAVIDASVENPAQATVEVDFLPNVVTYVHVWTRPRTE